MREMKDELLPCPFCGGRAKFGKRTEACYDGSGKVTARAERYRVYCTACFCDTGWCCDLEEAISKWNTRYKETAVYDQEETVEGCTVQILTNSETGDVSVGWWKDN